MTFEKRFKAVRLMHETMLSMNNENAYMAWIWVMPDEPTNDDFAYFANDENEFMSLKDTFDRLYRRYIKDGLFEPSPEVLPFLEEMWYPTDDIDVFRRH